MRITVHAPLTVVQIVRLGQIVEVARTEGRVVFLDKDGTQHRGTARHIVVGSEPENCGFPGADRDIRDCYLRITMETGVERFELVSELVVLLEVEFFVYDWSKSCV